MRDLELQGHATVRVKSPISGTKLAGTLNFVLFLMNLGQANRWSVQDLDRSLVRSRDFEVQGHASRVTKTAIVTPILKKNDFDPDDVRNYRPISNQTFLFMVIERILASQLTWSSRSSVSLQTLHRDRSSEDLLRHPGCCRLGSGDAPWTAWSERGLRHCWSRHSPDKASSVLRCLGICVGLDRFICPASKSISQLQWLKLHKDTAAIRCAAGISPRTTLVYPLHLRCDINCNHPRCWSPIVRRRQSTQPSLPLHQSINCCIETDRMHRKCWAVDAIEPVETELGQDTIHVARVQATTAKIETQCMEIGEHCIKCSTSAKNLGVTFDPELSMDLQVNNITRSCFYQLKQLRSIRRSLTMEATKTLVHSLISSHFFLTPSTSLTQNI